MQRTFRTPAGLAALALAAAWATPEAAAGQASSSAAYVQSVKPNVVVIRAGAKGGFGFVVGLDEEGLLVATAEHTLRKPDVPTPEVCFLERPPPCPTGTVVYVADPVEPGAPDLDLAVVRAPYPEGLRWRPDVMADAPSAGQPVWFIGRAGDWVVPSSPGTLVDPRGADGAITYEGLPVAGGVSGAPVLTPSGIVAMHLRSSGSEGVSTGLSLEVIRRTLSERMQGQWALVPRADCSDRESIRPLLEGRSVGVHFRVMRPGSAFAAMARLACLGVRVIPRPVGADESWPGPTVGYRSGDLRLARTLQIVLRSAGRFDTRLAEPEGDAEVWIE